MNTLLDRMLRAARLDPALYEEVEADGEALTQAMVVVIVSSLAAGIGDGGEAGLAASLFATAAALVGWVVWAAVIWLVGTKLLPGPNTEADIGQLLRVIGFASAPGVLRMIGVIPALRAPIAILTMFWTLAAMIVAVRQALDYESTGRAVAVCAIGLAVQVIAVTLLLFAVMPDGPLPGGEVAPGTGIEAPAPAPAPTSV